MSINLFGTIFSGVVAVGALLSATPSPELSAFCFFVFGLWFSDLVREAR